MKINRLALKGDVHFEADELFCKKLENYTHKSYSQVWLSSCSKEPNSNKSGSRLVGSTESPYPFLFIWATLLLFFIKTQAVGWGCAAHPYNTWNCAEWSVTLRPPIRHMLWTKYETDNGCVGHDDARHGLNWPSQVGLARAFCTALLHSRKSVVPTSEYRAI